MGKSVRVSNGTETLEIPESDLAAATKDGYLPTERVIIMKGKEKLEIDPQDLPDAMKDGYNFLSTKKKATSDPVGTPSANGTPPTSPSKSSSSSVSAPPPVIASSGNQIKDLVDYVKGTGSFDNAKAANSEAAQKAIPKIVARQAAKQKPLTEVGAVPRPKVLSDQDAQAKAKEALSDPLMNVWASRSPDPIGELQKGANDAYDGTKAFTVRNGNDASVYGQMAKLAERSFLPNEAAASAYLKSRGVDVEGVPDANLATIEPRNVTEKVALDRVNQGRTIKNLLATSTVEDAAVEYAASQDPALARQIQTLGTNYRYDLPNAMQGKLISDFLENPDVIARAEADPTVKNKYTVAAVNLNSNFPDYAKTRIANIIGQERENRGDNNGIVNIVGQKATDKLVDELITEGKLTASDKVIYQKYIQPKLSVLQSVGRGVGRAIPLTMAFTDEAPIETPGLAENFQNSFVGTLHGMAKSIEDTPSALGSVVGGDQKGKLYDVLKSDYTAKALDPKGTWHAITQNTGHLTGFMVPMILGGEVAQGVGIPAKAASALTAYLTFEGQNAEQALKMFPGDPTKQYLHTALATGGDMFLTELLPLAKAASGAKAALRSEITNTINSFTDGNITAAVAKETLLKKAAKIVAGLPKENAKMGATMAGFSLFHNALDAAFGGRDVSAGQVADQAVDAFKSGFLGGSIISLATAGNNQKLTGSLVREMAERPDHFKALIEQGAKMDPSLAATANERIANLNEASLIWKDVQELPLTDAQKEKYLLSALNQKVWERKAEATSDDVVKRGYQEKAKVAGQAKESIYNGQDPATEHESFTEVARTTPPTEAELAQDVKNGRLTTVEFNDETEVPEIWKDKISSSGTVNGKKTVRVTLPTSQYEFDSRGGKSAPPADTFGYKEKIAAATTEQEKEQIAKEYADYLSAQQKTDNEPKAEQPLSNDEVAKLNSRKSEIQSLLSSDAASNEKEGQGSLIPEARKELLSELEGIKAKLGAAPKEEAAKAPDDTHLIVSSDTKSALASNRKKQVVVEEDGKPVVKEEDFTQEDAAVELDRLEFLAEKGRLTPEQFQKSYFGQAIDRTTFKSASERIKTDAKGFIADLRNSFEAKDEQKGNPLVPRETLIGQARELVRNSEIKGHTSETIKDAAENDPAKFEGYLENIAEQAKDPGSRAVTLDTYGKDIVDLAERLSDSKQTSKNNNVTLSNGEQPTVSNRLSPEEKRGNQIGGSELQAASDAVGRISDTSENNKASVEELRDKQGKELEQISKNNGTWVADPFKEFGNVPQAIGSEHNVYLDKDGQTLTKLNSAVKYDTWQDYLDNLAIHNTLFPTEAYTLKGFTDLSGDLTAVVQQPVVRGKEATFEQVKEDMAKMGFEHIPPSENPETPYDFVNKKTGVVISDLHGENVLVDANGKLRYIDTVIKKKPVENEATIPPTEASATDQGTTENSKGAKEATKFENPEEAVSHINSLPLSRVEATRMGAKQAEGVYLSTEDANRYSSESNPARSVTVDIKNPKVTDYVENTNLQHEKIGQLLDANEVSASDISSEYRPELEKFAGKSDVTNEDVSNWYRSKEGSRINEDYFEQTVRTKAAKLITEQYKTEGHDALYIPATKNTEGELIVFDSKSVKFEPANNLSKEQKYTTKTGKYSVEYRDGKRVVVDKQGNVLPEYIKVKAKKGILTDKEGNPRMVEQRNKVRDNVLREHDKEYKYNFGAKADPNEMPGGLSDKQAGEWVIENSSNPAELANLYKKTSKESAELNEIEQAIADNGIGKVKAKSYYDFGDRNNMTATKARTYLNDRTGYGIDVIAKEIADHTGKDVTPQHIIDFIDRFPKGDATVLRDGELHQQAATKFEELTGIPLTERVAEKAASEYYDAAKREAEETSLASEPMDADAVKQWIEETAQNIYDDARDNAEEFNGQPTKAIQPDKEQPANVGSVQENTGTEMAGRSATSAEQGSSETPNSEGQDGPPAKEEPTALGEQDPELTKMANAVNDEHIKGKFGVDALSRVIDQLQDTDIKKVYDNVKDRIRRGVLDVRKVRERIMTTRKGSEEDQAALLYDLAELKGRESELQKDIISETDADRKKELQNQLMQVQNDMMDNAIANRLLGRAASSIFRLRQVWADRGMELVDFEEQYKASKGISELSEDQKTAVKKEFDEINQLKTERDNARAELDKAKAENERIIAENNKLKQFENKAKEQKKADRNKKTDETIDKSNKRIQDAKDNLRKLRGDMNDVTRVLPRVAAEISKIAAEKFYQGVVKAHELVLNVLDEVKDVFPHWTEDDVRAHLFPEFDGNEPLRYSVEDYRASSEKVQKKLDAYKRLNAEYAQKMFEWQRDRRSDIMGKRPLKERVIDGILRWQRFAVLSYPTTVIKLASVVGWNLVAKPFKLGLQKMIYEMANLPSRLTGGFIKNPLAKAPTWGNVSLSSMAKYYSALIRNFSRTNLKEQFSGLDTKEIMYGKGMYYDEWAAGKGFLEMPGRSHGYIKSFVKNPEFAFAHEQLLTNALKNMDAISKQLDNPNLSEAERTALKNDYDAIDITNIDNLEKINTLALEHGKWAILMNDNKFVEKFRNWADQKTITSALIRSELPIIKIPVNYIGRAFAIKYGLIRAIAGKGRWEGGSTSYPGMVEMMIKGTKDLTPEQADMFGKVLNLGSMGLAFFLMGYLNRDKIKHNEDGSVEFFGTHISKNLVHSPEFESMFNGSEVGNKIKGKDGEGFISAMVEADFDMAKKNPFAQTLEYGFIANVAGAMLQKGETKGKTVDRVVDAAYKKIADMIEPGGIKQPAGWLDTKDKGFHPMNDPIRRKPAGDKFERFYQTLELGIPGLRDNVPKNKHKQ